MLMLKSHLGLGCGLGTRIFKSASGDFTLQQNLAYLGGNQNMLSAFGK